MDGIPKLCTMSNVNIKAFEVVNIDKVDSEATRITNANGMGVRFGFGFTRIVLFQIIAIIIRLYSINLSIRKTGNSSAPLGRPSRQRETLLCDTLR